MVHISIYNPLKHISQLEQCQIVIPNCEYLIILAQNTRWNFQEGKREPGS